jgi:hypothetical protein
VQGVPTKAGCADDRRVCLVLTLAEPARRCAERPDGSAP